MSIPPDIDNAVDELADLFHLLGDPTRLRIVLACLAQPTAVGDIAGALNLSSSLVSHHLRLLRHPPQSLHPAGGGIALVAALGEEAGEQRPRLLRLQGRAGAQGVHVAEEGEALHPQLVAAGAQPAIETLDEERQHLVHIHHQERARRARAKLAAGLRQVLRRVRGAHNRILRM